MADLVQPDKAAEQSARLRLEMFDICWQQLEECFPFDVRKGLQDELQREEVTEAQLSVAESRHAHTLTQTLTHTPKRGKQ
jgi:hypothetical protein